MKLNNKTAKKIKSDFPIFKNNQGLIYLDNAATSQKPKQVIKAITDFYEKDNSNVERGLYTLAERGQKKYDESRKVVAKFIGAKKEEVIFTKNTTESINLLSYTLSKLFKKGKNEIVVTEMEHHANFIPWQQMAKRHGFKFKVIKLKDDFTLDMEDAKMKVTNKTAVLAFTHVSNALGSINNIGFLLKLAKSKNAFTVIDSAQSISHIKTNVKKLDCDFLAFSGHKMLGPLGAGVLYGKKELLDKLSPFKFGGGMIRKVTSESSEWADTPRKFEAGTLNASDAIGLAEAIKYLEKIGLDNIHSWIKELTEYALKKLNELEGIEIYNPGIENSAGVISFNLKGVHPHDVSEILNSEKIAIRGGHHCAMPLMKSLGIHGTSRISFSFYNTFEDIDKTIEVLKKIQKKFM